MISAVTDDPLPADLDHIRVTLERTRAVGRRLIGLHVDDARKLATQFHCHFRVVSNPIMTAELDIRRVPPEAERRWGPYLRRPTPGEAGRHRIREGPRMLTIC
jgi:hypothetical protein